MPIQVPIYQPRLPMHGGGGIAGVLRRGPSTAANIATGVGGLVAAIQAGRERERQRAHQALERLVALHKAGFDTGEGISRTAGALGYGQVGKAEPMTHADIMASVPEGFKVSYGRDPLTGQPTYMHYLPEPEKEERDIFTEGYKAKVYGDLLTGVAAQAYGLPLQTLTTRKDHIVYATRKLGPDWQKKYPEALRIIDMKFPGEKGASSQRQELSRLPQEFQGTVEKARKVIGGGEPDSASPGATVLPPLESPLARIAPGAETEDLSYPKHSFQEFINQLMRGGAKTQAKEPTGKKIRVRAPDGRTGWVPAEDLEAALKEGYEIIR